ncbi:respiratory nitrate reductase subunit delta [Brucella sp. 10RB9215]|uniref:Nitrate reductase molybdenum cofactor assembly chaperone n=13 Tax=Brucella TaxID=234 RepID=A9ME49_BRUC2|nr:MULTISPECIES: nitrate reductase molybdenum cofactor assembly chaperone [Brucella]ERU11141.1 nitrate reductase molybdenum cofactor assembly chaperone [Brucella abortus 07-0994-2411]AAN33497.1 respiratory nitrate reductase, delta subunit [Brucella suis 1330]ABQ62700.1 respiratory nitrate reductase, delta subunit [Brucella ovis ATCC 25840]ABX63487.1 nitrate reductase molybdenum cofactor assembly chaperone [Brucella canis ATCC 23365]ACU49427.1 respiratory nitrate reductase, delta subunit [Bruce
MNRTLKIISLLLSYPSPELQAGRAELKAALEGEKNLSPGVRRLLDKLVDYICTADLYEAQERYVHLFDRTRSLSLHLFEHVHGESRDRGQAMVDLGQMYEDNGFDIDAKELPDYLPLFLEFLSTRSTEEIHDLLTQTGHITAAIGERLRKRQSPYAGAFAALLHLANAKPDEKLVGELLRQEEDDPDDLAALDRIWEEEAVTFGANAGENACGPDRLRMQMRAAHRKPASPSTQI